MNKMITDVIHFYRVKSLENTKVFYQDILGFSLYKDQGQCLIYDTGGYGKIGFCTHFPKPYPKSPCITCVVETKKDVDILYHTLKKHIKTIEAPSENQAFKIYHFFLKDFNGLTVEVQTFNTD